MWILRQWSLYIYMDIYLKKVYISSGGMMLHARAFYFQAVGPLFVM